MGLEGIFFTQDLLQIHGTDKLHAFFNTACSFFFCADLRRCICRANSYGCPGYGNSAILHIQAGRYIICIVSLQVFVNG